MIRTPDHRLRVFISSTLQELLPERRAARAAVRRLHLSPVMFEIGARPHPPRELYRAYLEQSHIFVGIYWERYGWVAPDEEISGLEDEYRLCGDRPKLIYVKRPGTERQPRLVSLLQRIQDDDTASYKPFDTAAELQRLLTDDLALLLTERFEASLVAASGQPVVGADASFGERPVADTSAEPRQLPASWPRAATPLIGRERELADLVTLLHDPTARLVTLVGPGGIGKSRLAAALDAASVGADEAVFVPLASVTDPDLVVPAVADALGVPDEGGDRLAAVAARLAERKHLVVLDNLEQVLSAAPVVAELVARCPSVRIVVTSRAPLRVAAERELPVSPLATPTTDATPDLLESAAAVQLFVTRARAVRPTFALDATTASVVGELTRRLDGLPLAIELAAARLKVLPPAELLRRLDRRFEVLAGGARDLPERQQTLRSTIAWSVELLGEDERRSLAELSVFAGGWTIESAEAVLSSPAALEHVVVLVDNSLAEVHEAADENRFDMLESVRAYAHELLEGLGADVAATARARHAAYLLGLAEAARTGITGPEQQRWLTRLEAEHENVVAALAWLRANPDGDALGRLATGLIHFWWIRGHYTEGRHWLAAALEGTTGVVRSRALDGLGILAWLQGDYDEARVRYEESMELSRASRDDDRIASALGNLGIIAIEQDDLDAAQPLLEEGLAITRRVGDAARIGAALVNLSLVLIRRRRLDEAGGQLEEAVALFRGLGDAWGVTTVLINLGDVRCAQGRIEESARCYTESLRLARDIEDDDSIAYALEGFASIAAARGAATDAGLRWGAAERLREVRGNPRPPSGGASDLAAEVAAMRALAGDDAFDAAWSRGRSSGLAPLLDGLLDELLDEG